jgi:DNA-binding transcriptional ArsR family regulator
MPDTHPSDAGESYDLYLKGTTYRVYRFILKHGGPVGISEIQKGLGLSSPSVSQYHIKKLLRLGLIKEEQEGFVVERVVVENVIRFRRTAIPIQTAYVTFFGITLLILLALLRPASINSVYFLAVVVNCAALGVSLYEMSKTLKKI